MKILMVCLGNICRSPMAEGIMQQKIRERGLPWEVESSGTGSWHVGESPDRRAVEEARRNGIDISQMVARQFRKKDLDEYDLILTMDASNYRDVLAHCRNGDEREKVKMILNYPFPGSDRSVPDPYFEGSFDGVFRLLEDACEAVIDEHAS